uniref:thymidylate synthase n=1 Tax=viral metagenome TaxID=1070528 RepID=A0A6C0BD52_9ZZZZ
MRFIGLSVTLSNTTNNKISSILSTTKYFTNMEFYHNMQTVIFYENDYKNVLTIMNCINIVIAPNKPNGVNFINDNTLMLYVNSPIDALKFAIEKKFNTVFVYVNNCENWFVENNLFDEFRISQNSKIQLYDYINKFGKKKRETNTLHSNELHSFEYYYFCINDKYNKDLQRLINDISYEPLIENRTIEKTRNLFNQNLSFNLRGGVIPLCTVNKRWVRGVFYELMWFLKGRTDLEYLHKYNIHIWDANCETPQLGSVVASNNIGKIYGYQWRNFGGSGFDQISYIVNLLKTDPNSRRIVLSSWCPPDIFTDSCLPPCHVLYCFNVNSKGELMCHLTQRSSDVGVGLPWNIASASILINLLAKTCGLVPGSLDITLCNAHIYESHQSILNEQYKLSKTPNYYPRIIVNNKKNIDEYEYEDIFILDYTPEFSKNTLPMIV